MFLDIESFTAWSSEREPSQVFILLETIYQSFDQIAAKLKVFKVETIGGKSFAVLYRRLMLLSCLRSSIRFFQTHMWPYVVYLLEEKAMPQSWPTLPSAVWINCE